MTAPGSRGTELTRALIRAAGELGFARVGVVALDRPTRYPAYERWLERGFHGEMGYMAGDRERQARADFDRILPGARSAVVVLASYEHRQPERITGNGRVARYVHGADYHRVVKQALAKLVELVDDETSATSRVCVDTAPILERDLAERAGLGFIGKNTMLITPGLGSYTFIGTMLTTAVLEPTEVADMGDRCGSCTACLDACPTAAFPEPHVLDARRCISYLTIEHRSSIDDGLRPALGAMVYGCDVCQEVCPYNARAPQRHPIFEGLSGQGSPRTAPRLADLIALRAGGYRRLTRGSAMDRARQRMLKRNAAIAAGNTGEAKDALIAALGDPNPEMRAVAAWALGRCGGEPALRERLGVEDDPEVREAINEALSRSSDSGRGR